MERQFCYRDLAGMPTLGDVWAVGKPRQSEATTLATFGCSGAKYSIPIPHSPRPLSPRSPETVLSKTDVNGRGYC